MCACLLLPARVFVHSQAIIGARLGLPWSSWDAFGVPTGSHRDLDGFPRGFQSFPLRALQAWSF